MFEMALFDCACDYPCNPWKMLQCWRRTAGVFALFFLSHPGGYDSSRVPTPGNLPSKAKKTLMPGCQPRGEGGWAQCELTHTLIFLWTQFNKIQIYMLFTLLLIIFYLYSFFIAPVEGLCCKPKYRANVIHHSIFFSSYIFSITLPAVRIILLF